MNSICQLDQYTAVVSELTQRTIYVNNSLDKYLISPACDLQAISNLASAWVQKIEELQPSITSTPTPRPPASLISAVKGLIGCSNIKEFATHIESILHNEFRAKLPSASVMKSQRYLVELMLGLWSIGALAWPVKEQAPFSSLSLDVDTLGFSVADRAYLEKIKAYLYKGSVSDAANIRFAIDNLLSRANIQEIGDITPKTYYLSQDRNRYTKLKGLPVQAILNVLRDEYHDVAIKWAPEDFGLYQSKMGRLKRDDDFHWLTSQDPEMKIWADLAKTHIKNAVANFKKRKSSINVFLEHYLKHPELPRNPMQYFDIHNRPTALLVLHGNQKRQTMSAIGAFLDDVLFTVCTQPNDSEIPVLMPGFANPLPRLSYKNVNRGETHREAMPTRLIGLATRILVEDDFAWAKKIGRLTDTFRWENPETKGVESVWSPVRAYLLLIKLLLPARTYQVRMLDSGEGDTYRYQINGEWTNNQGPHSPRGSQKPIEDGVFRRYKRKDESFGSLLYFNTNKTADIDSISKGYIMPWEKLDALKIFAELRDWQEKYNPIKTSTEWTDIGELKKAKHVDDLIKMGSSYFLFRDPCQNARRDLPITDVRIRGLWLRLMEEVENRLAHNNQTLTNGDPIKLILSRDKTNQPQSAVFDLHSLRVSIITAMYEEGIPPEYLMKIVGHASVLMTLYYTKINAETLSLRMDDALLERQRKSQSEMIGFIKKSSRQELEQAVAFMDPVALDAAKNMTGVGFLVMDHGICPVSAKKCYEGLAVPDAGALSTKFQAVPGGASNCVRCRFFMTGPAFLPGLEAHVNDLAYRLKNSSVVFEESQKKFDDLSDAQAMSLSGGPPFHKQRELEVAETSFESALAETDNVAHSLQAAYCLTEQCIEIATFTKGDGVSLVAVGGIGQIEAVLSETHEFEQLNRICTNATFFDGLNINWKQPNLERARMFDRMLRNSGIEPRFSLLSDEDALHACNAMGEFLYARMDSKSVHALIDGRTTLRAAGIEKPFIEKLEFIQPKNISFSKNVTILEQE